MDKAWRKLICSFLPSYVLTKASISDQAFQRQLPIRHFRIDYPSGISTYRFNHLVLAITFTWHGALDFTSGYGTRGWSVPSREYTCDILLCFFFPVVNPNLSVQPSWTHVSYPAFKVRMTIRQSVRIRGGMQNSVPVCQKRIHFTTILCSPFNFLSLL